MQSKENKKEYWALRSIDLKPIKVTPESCGSATEFDELLSQGLVCTEKFYAEGLREDVLGFLAIERRKRDDITLDEQLLADFKGLLSAIKPHILRIREIKKMMDMARDTLRNSSNESPLSVQVEYNIRRDMMHELEYDHEFIAMLVNNVIYNNRLY
jgi:hypothetical protein